MPNACQTTITAIMLRPGTDASIFHLVDALLSNPETRADDARALAWQSGDLVFFEFAPLRISLEKITQDDTSVQFICAGVGPMPGRTLPEGVTSAAVSQTLVERLLQLIEASAVMNYEKDAALSTAVLAEFAQELKEMAEHLREKIRQAVVQPRRPMARIGRKSERPTEVSKIDPLANEAAITELRHELRFEQAKDPEINSVLNSPMHASLYLMASTFIFMAPPIGTSLFSYIAIRDGLDKFGYNQ